MAKKTAAPSYSAIKMTKEEAFKQLKDALFYQMQRSQSKLDESVKKLNENFYYYFSWVGLDALENDITYHLIKRDYDRLFEKGFTYFNDNEEFKDSYFFAFNLVSASIKENKDFCSRAYNVRTASTSELSNITSTAEFKMRLELIEFYEKSMKWYTRETELTEDDRKILDDIRFRVENPSYPAR